MTSYSDKFYLKNFRSDLEIDKSHMNFILIPFIYKNYELLGLVWESGE
jgi:hypothetical protein